MKDLLLDILSNYGLSEFDGPLSNPQILEFFTEIGYNWVEDDSKTSWCSAMISFFAKRHGYERSGKLDARSWLKVGEKVTKPQLGDIVVFWRVSPTSWEGHVGLYVAENSSVIYVLGGNQSNQINITPYAKSRLLGYRRLRKLYFYAPYRKKTMEIRIKTIYIVAIALGLLVGSFFIGRTTQNKQVKAQQEQILSLRSEVANRDMIITGQQMQSTMDSVVISSHTTEIGMLRRSVAARNKQIVNLRYSVAVLNDSINYILTNVIECPPCDPELPALYLPFRFGVDYEGIDLKGEFDEEARLVLRVVTAGATDITIHIPEK